MNFQNHPMQNVFYSDILIRWVHIRSGLIGELPIGRPANLVPAITQTAIGKLPQMQVYGDDYPTRDGSCIRDYIHVCDIAHAHTLASDVSVKRKNHKEMRGIQSWNRKWRNCTGSHPGI